jgi:hypothetical protein
MYYLYVRIRAQLHRALRIIIRLTLRIQLLTLAALCQVAVL